MLKRRLIHLLLALIALGGLLAIALGVALRASLLSLHGTQGVTGLAQPVEIRFDHQARAYVRAATFDDALFAQGWLHATQRLWQFELLRRAGRGRLAEMLGADLLDTDKELWRLGVPQLAARLEANATTELRGRVARYVDGMNAGIAALPVRPPEFLLTAMPPPRVEARDVYALGAVLAVESARNQGSEALRLALASRLDAAHFAAFLLPEALEPDYPYVIPATQTASSRGTPSRGDPALQRAGGPWSEFNLSALSDLLDRPRLPRFALGSNSWALAPHRTQNGHALLAFDSHDELGMPALFYEVHLFFAHAGAPRQVRGWSVPGLPGVINGYNEAIAWGFTNSGDSQDLFLETRSSDGSGRFRRGDEWVAARSERVEIPVRGRSAPEVLEIIHAPHGPLLTEEPPLALAWTAHRIGQRGLDALLQLNLARNWHEFNAALDQLAAPSLNATYADCAGHIGNRSAGLLPRRGAGRGLQPLDGRQSANDWRGLVAAADMPRRYDPPEGFVAAANARVNAPGDGPLVAADVAPAYRAARLREVLSAPRQFSAEALRALQTNWHDTQAAWLLPPLLAGLREAPQSDPAWQAAFDLLAAWQADPQDQPAWGAPLIFQHWYLQLARDLFGDQLGDDLLARLMKNNYLLNQTLDRLLLNDADSPWWQGARNERIRTAFRRTLTTLVAQVGADPRQWRLDQHQRLIAQHALSKAVPPLGWWFDAGPYSPGGGPATLGRASYSYFKPFAVRYGATVRTVIEMAPVPRASSVMPGGQSGHPLSVHYRDQFDDWLAGRQTQIAATPETVDGPQLRLIPQ